MFWSIHNACSLDNWCYKRSIFLSFFFFLTEEILSAYKQGKQDNTCVIHATDTTMSVNGIGV